MIPAKFAEIGDKLIVVNPLSNPPPGIESQFKFNTVKIEPAFQTPIKQFFSSFLNKANGLPDSARPTKPVDISLYYTITSKAEIIIDKVTGEGSYSLKQALSNSFQSTGKVNAGMMNGYYANVLCKAIFHIEKTDKGMEIKLKY